jgi:tRNA(Leu) C34 or U34 (ribose-2'-O)-methylase TrmL
MIKKLRRVAMDYIDHWITRGVFKLAGFLDQSSRARIILLTTKGRSALYVLCVPKRRGFDGRA